MTTIRTVAELAELVGGEVLGDGSVEIKGVAAIEQAGPGDITFVAHPKYRPFLSSCRASAIVIKAGLEAPRSGGAGPTYIRVSQPYLAFARILQQFAAAKPHGGQVSPHAVIEPSARLGEGVTIFPHVYIGTAAQVGAGSVLYPGVFLGDYSVVGRDCVLYPQVTVGERCRLGDRVIAHAGVVIGSDGFGYAGEGAERIKIPQLGIVEIEDDVEIGANSTIDRATLGKTLIQRGTKIDNLVHVAHNVTVGEHSLIIAQAGIAGSTKIGRGVVLAGQVGVVNHIEIGDGAMIGPQSGVAQPVPARAVLSSGIPALPHRQWLRVVKSLAKLPELLVKVRGLERKLARPREADRNRGGKRDA
ncbi:MAG TPA: UDP-3-O-(3-hydroxymyristoyl)glucosamine N-acyltransferase [Candidatus Acidoferrales bacterium]|nr:UDP-3-O-(3-hydroxymyristoyl)glucosamine N-acyltransferase [Candidatus Acidoferrales bacterium]